MTSQRSRELDALEDSYKLRIKQLADNKDREASVSHVLLSLSLARQTSGVQVLSMQSGILCQAQA